MKADLNETQKASIESIRQALSTTWPWSLTKNVGGDKHLREAADLHIYQQVPEDIELSNDELQEYETILKDLKQYQTQYQQMICMLQSTSSILEGLMENYSSVAHKTSSLHDTCEQLMADQTRLASAAQELRDNLTYFEYLEQITHKLSSPLINVSTESFVQMLNTIDECMQFMVEHRQYKDSASYLAKYQHCLSRALSLVKSHICSLLTNAVQTVRSKGGSGANEDAFTLYYGLFAAQAPTVRSIMEQIECRRDRNQEYQLMLDDVYQFYFTQRETLIAPSVSISMQDLLKKHPNNLCGLVRSGCSFLSRLCEDEQTLYYRFFSRTTPLFADFAERISGSLYEATRPQIVHVLHLETLAELCLILKAESSFENKSVADMSASTTEEFSYPSDAAYGFARAISSLLGDVRERLVYRAQLYARNDIAGYQPAHGDLAYPEKLEMMFAIANSLHEQKQAVGHHIRQPSVDSVHSTTSQEVANIIQQEHPESADTSVTGARTATVSPADLHGLWYPPVRRAIMCLSKLYKCLDATVFHGLCQDVLSMTIQSLNVASLQIKKEKSVLDGYLFLIKHLLILREQTYPFRTDSSISIRETTMDFSKLKNAAANLIVDKKRLYSLSNNSLLEFILQVPNQVSEQVVDNRRALDFELRSACQQFIGYASQAIGGGLELEDFVQKTETILDERKKDTTVQPLKSQPFAAPDKVRDLVAKSYRQLKDAMPNLMKKLNLYIASRDTESILFTPVKKSCHLTFKKVVDVVASEYSEEEQQIIACPTIEQVNLLLSTRTDN